MKTVTVTIKSISFPFRSTFFFLVEFWEPLIFYAKCVSYICWCFRGQKVWIALKDSDGDGNYEWPNGTTVPSSPPDPRWALSQTFSGMPDVTVQQGIFYTAAPTHATPHYLCHTQPVVYGKDLFILLLGCAKCADQHGRGALPLHRTRQDKSIGGESQGWSGYRHVHANHCAISPPLDRLNIGSLYFEWNLYSRRKKLG